MGRSISAILGCETKFFSTFENLINCYISQFFLSSPTKKNLFSYFLRAFFYTLNVKAKKGAVLLFLYAAAAIFNSLSVSMSFSKMLLKSIKFVNYNENF